MQKCSCNKRVNLYWCHYYCPDNYRVLRGFTYNGQPKKEKPTVHRWKTEKRGGGSYWHGGSWKKDWKHFTARKHRAWQHQMLARESYDEFYDRSYIDSESVWSWD